MRAGLVAAAALVALGTMACRAPAPTATPTRVPPTAAPSRTPSPTPTLAPVTSTPLPMATPTAAPTPLPVASPTEQPHIILTQVSAQTDTPGMLQVAGRAQVFEATVSLRLRSLDGRIIVQGVTMASGGAPAWGEFSVDVAYPPPLQDEPAALEVYEESPRDGSAQSLVSTAVTLRSAPELSQWQTFVNPTYRFRLRFPPTWQLNQGASAPPPPATTRFSTYKAGEVQSLRIQDAEVWVRVSDTPSIAEMEDLEGKGYVKRNLILDGRAAVRYTDRTPHHGVYDVVYTLTGPGEYRIHLSAASHAFDALFALMLSSFAE